MKDNLEGKWSTQATKSAGTNSVWTGPRLCDSVVIAPAARAAPDRHRRMISCTTTVNSSRSGSSAPCGSGSAPRSTARPSRWTSRCGTRLVSRYPPPKRSRPPTSPPRSACPGVRAWGTAWFHFSGQVPAEWAGERDRGRHRPRLQRRPGLLRGGPGAHHQGRPAEGPAPAPDLRAAVDPRPGRYGGLARRQHRVLRRGGRQPRGTRSQRLRPGGRPRRQAGAGRQADLPADPRGPGRLQRRGLGPDPRPGGAGRPAEGAASRRSRAVARSCAR